MKGWECPKCGKSWSPTTQQCHPCNKVQMTKVKLTTTCKSDCAVHNEPTYPKGECDCSPDCNPDNNEGEMMETCKFCGEGLYPEFEDWAYNCGSLIGATAPETGQCHSGYVHRLKSLVREMGKLLTEIRPFLYTQENFAHKNLAPKIIEIINRIEVKAIMKEENA